MSDNSKRKTWPSRRQKLKWQSVPSKGTDYQEATAGRYTRRPRGVFVTSDRMGNVVQWLWGEVGRVAEHPVVATEVEAKRLAEEEYGIHA